LGLFGSFGA